MYTKNLTRLAAVLAVSAALGGCTFFTTGISNPISYNQLGGVESGYGIALSAAVAYRNLPLCRTGTIASAVNVCAQRSIIVKLQQADRTAETAIAAANAFVANNPTLDPTNVIAAAQSALAGFQAIEATYGVK